MYKYRVNFEKTFVDGILKGKHYTNDYIRFCDWSSADNFAKSCDGITVVDTCTNTGKYTKSYPILTALE